MEVEVPRAQLQKTVDQWEEDVAKAREEFLTQLSEERAAFESMLKRLSGEK